MVPEEALRRLQAVTEGTDPEPSVQFLGQPYLVRTDGRLAALLAYASTGQPTAAERVRLESLGDLGSGGTVSEQAMLAAAYDLLEQCLDDFAGFASAAFDGKASAAQVRDAVMRVIEVVTARPPMAALRLLGYVTANLAEFDGGLLMAGGPGLAAMSAREACNAAFARALETIEPDRQAEWKEDLYLDYSPEDQALEMVRKMQADRKAREEAGDDSAG